MTEAGSSAAAAGGSSAAAAGVTSTAAAGRAKFAITAAVPEDEELQLHDMHVILVLDNSASMLTRDVARSPGPMMSRRDALNNRLIVDFIKNALGSSGDRLSVVAFEDNSARAVLELKPMHSGLQVQEALAAAKQSDKRAMDEALAAAKQSDKRAMDKLIEPVEVLKRLIYRVDPVLNEDASTHVFFFSDGTASGDQLNNYNRIQRINQVLRQSARALLEATTHPLTGHFVGFGRDDFTALRALTAVLTGSKFHKVDRTLQALSTTISDFTSTIASSRLESKVAHAQKRELRPVNLSLDATTRRQTYRKCTLYFAPDMEDLIEGGFEPELDNLGTADLEIAEAAFKCGGERNVFNMMFCSSARKGKLTGIADGAWVVKEDKYKARSDAEEVDFHRQSLVTQTVAEHFSDAFNHAILHLGLSGVPKVAFMQTCYVETDGPPIPAQSTAGLRPASAEQQQSLAKKRCLFAEKHICGPFRKWNSNNGHVVVVRPQPSDASGSAASSSAAGIGGGAPRKRVNFQVVREEQPVDDAAQEDPSHEVIRDVPLDDVAQAFSHWTHEQSRQSMKFKGPDGTRADLLVCDIQGTFSEPGTPDGGEHGTFKLIDPVVHSVGLSERCFFGATDRGQRGIKDFFASHKCNRVCELLHLPPNEQFVAEKIQYESAANTNASLLTLHKRHHADKQKKKRDIPTKVIQYAVKHGDKRPGTGENTVQHQVPGEDVSVVTSRDGRVVVTAIRHERQKCWQWAEKGSCRFGASCRYLHGESPAAQQLSSAAKNAAASSPAAPQQALSAKGGHDPRSLQPCKWWPRKGGCRMGSQCPFLHGERSLQVQSKAPATTAGQPHPRAAPKATAPPPPSPKIIFVRNAPPAPAPPPSKPPPPAPISPTPQSPWQGPYTPPPRMQPDFEVVVGGRRKMSSAASSSRSPAQQQKAKEERKLAKLNSAHSAAPGAYAAGAFYALQSESVRAFDTLPEEPDTLTPLKAGPQELARVAQEQRVRQEKEAKAKERAKEERQRRMLEQAAVGLSERPAKSVTEAATDLVVNAASSVAKFFGGGGAEADPESEARKKQEEENAKRIKAEERMRRKEEAAKLQAEADAKEAARVAGEQKRLELRKKLRQQIARAR
jgi:hypothetical protein